MCSKDVLRAMHGAGTGDGTGWGLGLVTRAWREMDSNAAPDTGQHADLGPHPLSDLQMEPMGPPSRT